MPCSDFADSLHALIDGTLPATERPRLEIHLEACADCRELLEDLRTLTRDARALESVPAPDGLWLRVAARLREQGATSEGDVGGRLSRRWLAIAASLVAVIGLALFASRWIGPAEPPQRAEAEHEEPAPDPDGNIPPAVTVEGIEAELRLAEEHYEKAISGLEQVASQEQASLDPQVAETVKRNLQVIDEAIAESRSALRAEPQSRPARESLFEALRRKIVLLQDTIALVNEMRKGNQAGAGDIVEDLDKS